MFADVEEDVAEYVAHFGRRLEIVAVIALVPDLPTACELLVELARDADDEALHAARQRLLVRRLDDEMNVVFLDRIMDDLEGRLLLLCPPSDDFECGAKDSVRHLPLQGRQYPLRT